MFITTWWYINLSGKAKLLNKSKTIIDKWIKKIWKRSLKV